MSIDEVRARVELRALVDEYAWRTDHYDYEGYADLFTPDGAVSAVNPGASEPFFSVSGREELVGVVHGNDQFVRTFHAVENHRCSVDGRQASGVTYCTAHHLLSEGENPQTLVMLIRYHDEYAVTDAGWRFRSRRLEFAWVEYLQSDVSPYPFQRGSADWISGSYPVD
jgi:SnoaL-like domain